MHLGAFIAAARDRQDSASVFAALLDPTQCGFEEQTVGGEPVWTWMLTQDAVDDDIFRVTGPIVNFCGVVGLPFSRLRSSIPEDLLPGRTAAMVGRKGGLSAAWLTAQLAMPGNGPMVRAVRAMWGVRNKDGAVGQDSGFSIGGPTKSKKSSVAPEDAHTEAPFSPKAGTGPTQVSESIGTAALLAELPPSPDGNLSCCGRSGIRRAWPDTPSISPAPGPVAEAGPDAPALRSTSPPPGLADISVTLPVTPARPVSASGVQGNFASGSASHSTGVCHPPTLPTVSSVVTPTPITCPAFRTQSTAAVFLRWKLLLFSMPHTPTANG